jgi:peroxiredoxin (alkyl hydroperoxide reductase subunit C)
VVGKPAPSFDTPAASGGEAVRIRLDDFRGRWLVLFFYPLDFTFVCPTEIVAFDEALPRFEALGAAVLGCSVDSHHAHLAWMRTPRSEGGIGRIRFPLLSDLSKSIAAAYDVLDVDRALRGVFVIDPDGVVQAAAVHNLSIGRHVDDILRTLAAAKHVRERGESCPGNWREGDPGMEASLAGVMRVISP